MKTIIEKYGIKNIWHFTDRANLDSIREHGGLLSLKKIKERGIEIPVPGGNQWSHDVDESKGLDEYVHLAFVNKHPMLFKAIEEKRIQNPVWLEVAASILVDWDVFFCSTVSNKKGAKIVDSGEAVDEIDFEVLYTRMNWHDSEIHARRNAAEKSEILVPNIVPIDKILSLN